MRTRTTLEGIAVALPVVRMGVRSVIHLLCTLYSAPLSLAEQAIHCHVIYTVM